MITCLPHHGKIGFRTRSHRNFRLATPRTSRDVYPPWWATDLCYLFSRKRVDSLDLAQMDPRDTSRKYLNDLDRRTAIEHLHHAVDDTALAAHRFGDIVRRDGEDVWKRFDRRMEDSRWPGGGPNRHAADFTEVGRVLPDPSYGRP
jgi:hypothetical protein